MSEMRIIGRLVRTELKPFSYVPSYELGQGKG